MKETEGTSIRLAARDRKRINKALGTLSRQYYDSIPLGAINTVLKLGLGLQIIDSDGRAWSGLLCGDSGTVAFLLGRPAEFGPDCEEVTNLNLILQWYRMQSGRYEITTYLS